MYKLISLDMDGTLLNSKNEISIETQQSLELARNSGKICIIDTGRCLTELIPYEKELCHIQYGICESGGIIYDFFQNKIISKLGVISPTLTRTIIESVSDEDVMIQTMKDGRSYVNKWQIERMSEYQMGKYESLYSSTSEKTDDVKKFILSEETGFEKINIYHRNKESREKTFAKLRNLPLQFAFADESSLEVSPKNISKAAGLSELCRMLNVQMNETIAVGDAENDLPILRIVGLPVAVGNAIEKVKSECKVVVSDNDHDGCAEAIRNYLLKK